MLFLATRLRAEGARVPESRRFSREQIEAWIVEDEVDLLRFKAGACGFSLTQAWVQQVSGY